MTIQTRYIRYLRTMLSPTFSQCKVCWKCKAHERKMHTYDGFRLKWDIILFFFGKSEFHKQILQLKLSNQPVCQECLWASINLSFATLFFFPRRLVWDKWKRSVPHMLTLNKMTLRNQNIGELILEWGKWCH